MGCQAVVHPLPLATLRDQPRLAQDGQVLRDRGRREGKELDELADTDLALAQRPDDAQARGIRKGKGNVGEFVHMAQECRSAVDLSGLDWTQHQFVDQRNDRHAQNTAPAPSPRPRFRKVPKRKAQAPSAAEEPHAKSPANQSSHPLPKALIPTPVPQPPAPLLRGDPCQTSSPSMSKSPLPNPSIYSATPLFSATPRSHFSAPSLPLLCLPPQPSLFLRVPHSSVALRVQPPCPPC